jgi:hypothetical protein
MDHSQRIELDHPATLRFAVLTGGNLLGHKRFNNTFVVSTGIPKLER